jgi:hypothetical protein
MPPEPLSRVGCRHPGLSQPVIISALPIRLAWLDWRSRPPSLHRRPIGAAQVGQATAALTSSLVDTGFRDLDRMQADARLDPLRTRDDFQLLKLDFALPAEPFVRIP